MPKSLKPLAERPSILYMYPPDQIPSHQRRGTCTQYPCRGSSTQAAMQGTSGPCHNSINANQGSSRRSGSVRDETSRMQPRGRISSQEDTSCEPSAPRNQWETGDGRSLMTLDPNSVSHGDVHGKLSASIMFSLLASRPPPVTSLRCNGFYSQKSAPRSC